MAAALLLATAGSALADVHYVDATSTNSMSPYTNWATAAVTIQAAVDAAVAGDEIVVTNGIYAGGVSVSKPLTVRSVNGSQFTTMDGSGSQWGAILAAGASLSGFTLINSTAGATGGILSNCVSTGHSGYGVSGSTLNNCTVSSNTAGGAYGCTLNNCLLTGNSSYQGAGAYQCTLSNCTISANSASQGGGVYACTLNNCTLTGNYASIGGGAVQATLNNCTLTGNTGDQGGGGAFGSALSHCTLTGNSSQNLGGGAYGCSLTNCVVYLNTAPQSANYDSSCNLSYCCTTPLPASGVGNLASDPQLASASHLSRGSPCRGAGNAAYTSGTDIDGEAWANPPSIGCDEYHTGAVTGALTVGITASLTNVVTGYPVQFTGLIEGRTSGSVWDFGDGITATNQPYLSHAWAALGDYAVVLRAYNETQPAGIIATFIVHVVVQPIHYVDAANASPVAPYTSWATAARNIQDAVDAAMIPGALVLVTNGTYATGGRVVYGSLTNRVAVTKPLTLASVNGPRFTIIQGYQVPGTTNGDSAIRCVYLTNGATHAIYYDPNFRESSGGGLWCESTNLAVVSNCVVSGNSAYFFGGGVHGGRLNNCTLSRNSVGQNGGGAANSTLNNCTLSGNSSSDPYSGGGGAYGCMLNNCVLSGNSASTGAGASQGILNSCALIGNMAGYFGGGAYGCTLNNCNLTGNSTSDPYGSGGGAYGCTLNNCITYFNTASQGANYSYGALNYCCTTPLPANGVGNISSDPQLASASHVSAGSPCRGAGNTAYATGTDIDGEAWANPPSIGCDEYYAGALTGPLSVGITASFTSVSVGFPVQFTAVIDGRTTANSWDFADGSTATNQPYTSHAWAAAGDYAVVLRAFNESQPGGISATITIHVVNEVHYVASTSANPVAPYTSWATAARNIQDAVNAATAPGAQVLVTNGTYTAGGNATNRVRLNKFLTLQSVNGPQFTAIDGGQSVRCVSLNRGGNLSGFTLTNGHAIIGGGVWSESPAEVVSNCVFSGNSASGGGGAAGGTLNNCTLSGNLASDGGGGASGCTLNNCTLSYNSASGGGGAYYCTLNNCVLTCNSVLGEYGYGGGAASCTLNNCTLTGNSALGPSGRAGGAAQCTMNNCVTYFNTAHNEANYDSYSSLSYCCATPQPSGGAGNISLEPQLTSVSHLSAGSPCRGAGNAAYATGTDIDGETWANPPSIGCDEYHAGVVIGPLNLVINASFTNVSAGFAVHFTAFIEGRTTASTWDFGDGNMATNQPYIAHAWAAPGDYAVVLRAFNESQAGGISATVIVHVVNEVHYVAMGSANPVAPYASWNTAATNIQDAVDVATVTGALVLVTNGIYATGGPATNRVAVNKPLLLASVNGPAVTMIDGGQSVRCVSLASEASLVGFTLTNGTVQYPYGSGGGGVWCASPTAVVSNCIVSGNHGGGAFGGTLNNCTLTGNTASGIGGGAYECTLNDCTLSSNSVSGNGGGAGRCTLNNCMLSANYAPYGGGAALCTLNDCTLTANTGSDGGGASQCSLNNCTLTDNSAGYGGGASSGSTLNNCTLSGNHATGDGGGADYCVLNNCTLTRNSATNGGGAYYCTLTNCVVSGNLGWGAKSSTLQSCSVSANSGGGSLSNTLNNCTVTGNSGWGGFGSTLNNCIVYFNLGTNYDSSCTLSYCCATPQPTNGAGNISLDPKLASTSHLSAVSPCRGAGSASYVNGADIDGESWANPPSIGCDEYRVGSVTGPLTVAISAAFTNVTIGFPVQFTALIEGRIASSAWSFGDGVTATNQPYISHAWMALGDYAVVLRSFNESQSGGISATVTVHVVTGMHYVAATGRNPMPPYTSWATAATNIQDAIAAGTEPGSVVVVTNGIYGPIIGRDLLSVRSVNGPLVTFIDGGRLNWCAALTGSSSLSGFTLTNGAGGASGGIVNNCILTGNSGSVASSNTLNNCALIGNSGGAAVGATLNNCTVSGNSGGAFGCTLNNCIAYFNTAQHGLNYDAASTLNYCCTTPLPTNGVGNTSLDPQLASASHLSAASPCRGAGNAAYTTGTDIDGEDWASPPSIGCDEYHAGAVTGPLSVGITTELSTVTPGYSVVALGYAMGLTGLIQGRTEDSGWDFGDGSIETNQPFTSHAWAVPGNYLVALWAVNESHPEGIRATVTVHVVKEVHYVSAGSPNPVAPYSSWATAASSIQDAVNAATLPGAVVLVTNGTYYSVEVNQPLTVRSVNGPRFTVISGGSYDRCAHLANRARLSGFTLRNGNASNGAGVLCDSTDEVVSGCVISGNVADAGYGGEGGGAYGGTLNNCTINGNLANGHSYSYGYFCATGFGGGGRWCTFYSYSPGYGGGANHCTLNNCSLAGNFADNGSGGSYDCTLNNCIVQSASGGSQNHCWTADPLFVDAVSGNFRLRSDSPCINAGDNSYAVGSTDLDGRPRIAGGTVDIGAYEFQSTASGAFIGWLEQYGLRTDGSADLADPDGDRMNNWQEWIAGTDPTDSASALRLLTPAATPPGLLLRWSSDTNHAYFVERTRNLTPPITFDLLRTNVPGLSGTTTYIDTTAPSGGAAFYRVGTDSTNGSAALWLQTPIFVPAAVAVTWTSVSNRSYFLERSSDLRASPAFSTIQTNIPGQPGTTTYMDTTATKAGPWFYRVGVSP